MHAKATVIGARFRPKRACGAPIGQTNSLRDMLQTLAVLAALAVAASATIESFSGTSTHLQSEPLYGFATTRSDSRPFIDIQGMNHEYFGLSAIIKDVILNA
jgi:hypothetical protein